MLIRLGHSPDSDDAFMFYGLANGLVESEHQFEHILKDIQTLNEWAREGKLESTAISVHAFAYVAERYALLRHGGSFGEGYGPMVVATSAISAESLRDTVVAVPGLLTSAYLEYCLWTIETFGEGARPRFEVVPFDEIMPAIRAGRYAAGLIIHEGQLTYAEEGMTEILNLGRWWRDRTGGLPLPLGVNVVRKDLGQAICTEVSRCMRESIDAGLGQRSHALDYALQFARGMDRGTSDTFVGMYVNDRTRDMGDDGIKAIRMLLDEGARHGLVPAVQVDVID